jgi:hypothetical protein
MTGPTMKNDEPRAPEEVIMALRATPAPTGRAAVPAGDEGEPFYKAIHEADCEYRRVGSSHPCTCTPPTGERAGGALEAELRAMNAGQSWIPPVAAPRGTEGPATEALDRYCANAACGFSYATGETTCMKCGRPTTAALDTGTEGPADARPEGG